MTAQLFFLKFRIEQHPLFTTGTEFSVVNDARVLIDQTDSLTHLFGRVWRNNLVAIAGKNATGKTTVMKGLIGTLEFLLHGRSIDQTVLADFVLGKGPIKLTTYFYATDHYLYCDELTLAMRPDHQKWSVTAERILAKKVTKSQAKTTLFAFSADDVVLDRQRLDEFAAAVLADDDSLFRTVLATKKYQAQLIMDTLPLTNWNTLAYVNDEVPAEILTYLDPTIEYLRVEQKKLPGGRQQTFYLLKFKGQSEVYTETSFNTIEHYLSSGTAKGVTLYGGVLLALKTGGIIFVDELENHFNHAIVRTFLEYFTDPKTNPNRATLIFSTHYSEILDDLERGDAIYLVRRDERIELQRYSKADVRQDLNRTEVFDSNYLGGTAPQYDAYLKLRKATRKAVANGNE